MSPLIPNELILVLSSLITWLRRLKRVPEVWIPYITLALSEVAVLGVAALSPELTAVEALGQAVILCYMVNGGYTLAKAAEGRGPKFMAMGPRASAAVLLAVIWLAVGALGAGVVIAQDSLGLAPATTGDAAKEVLKATIGLWIKFGLSIAGGVVSRWFK